MLSLIAVLLRPVAPAPAWPFLAGLAACRLSGRIPSSTTRGEAPQRVASPSEQLQRVPGWLGRRDRSEYRESARRRWTPRDGVVLPHAHLPGDAGPRGWRDRHRRPNRRAGHDGRRRVDPRPQYVRPRSGTVAG